VNQNEVELHLRCHPRPGAPLVQRRGDGLRRTAAAPAV